MKKLSKLLILNICFASAVATSEIIPFNEENWEIEAKAFVLERYKGKEAIHMESNFPKTSPFMATQSDSVARRAVKP